MPFSPVTASKRITEKYYRYLKTSFHMGEPYKTEYERLIDNGESFASGPYLDVTDAFQKGKSISELIDEGILPRSFSKVRMNLSRPLYRHQENAVRKVAADGKNLVVSTGTGSGKTESFLIPILRELIMEDEAGTLSPGVRALLIYPMNALANDQTERLRELLADYPEITFGVYTGQTKHKRADALSEYKSLNQNRSPIKNELISRDEMIETPPHILITNYAMLEYLMIRPRDSVFFDGNAAKYWKFIVFDEAHVYNGSTGIEVSMLFRRLKAKLGAQKITYILTSATLGDKEDDTQVAEFAQKLCDAPFSASDIVRADRIVPTTVREISTLPLSFYEKIADAKNQNESDSDILRQFGFESADLANFLYDKIVHDMNYWKIRAILDTPQTVNALCSKMGWSEKQLTDFVTVASIAEKDGGKLFDARYHMFLRATESIFVTLAPDNHVMLHRSNFRFSDDGKTTYKVFEAGTCSYCNSIYLVGKIENDRLEQYNQTDDISTKEVFLLSSTISDTDDDHTFEDEGIDAEEYSICTHCGYLRKCGSDKHCEHNPSDYVKVFHIKLTGEKHTLSKCPKCENVNTSGILRMFFSGQEASTSVIGTALFEELPSYRITIQQHEADDEFGLDEGGAEEVKERVAKQFIAFSDSRQAAAFYASYLNISYNNILYKRLILETLGKIAPHGLTVPEFVDRLQTEFERHGVHGKTSFDEKSEYSVQKEAWKAVLSELVDSNGNTSLAHFGLIGVEWDIKACYKKYGISMSEFRDMCSVFAVSMMADAAIAYDASLNENDLEDFTHGGVLSAYTLSDPDGRKRNKSFVPARSGLSNKRVDYLHKILQKKGFALEVDEAAEFLKSIFNGVLVNVKVNALSLFKNNSYQVNTSKIRLFTPEHWYVCKKCNRLTCHNVENVCPAYHCDGELVEIDPAKEFADNHYYRLYREMEIRDLRIVEHTAQLDREMAYDYQKKFKQKEIDVLSCSTTFEMGVDVGSLETVFMRNMPPMPANYAQRAGRAGRSSQSAAFALTFCNKSSHDFTYFSDPTKMIKGKIEPPKYAIENDRIAIRHLYAAALSYFWCIHSEYFKTAGNFIEPDDSGRSGFDCLKDYLQTKPDDLKNYLTMFLSRVLVDKFDVQNFGWTDKLIGENGVLTEAVQTYKYEVSMLEEAKNERLKKNQTVDSITQKIKAYSCENILSFFSRKNVLPKYGFPVDTVEMTIAGFKHRNIGLQLQRDLSMAISEYAPGSQIVANNNLITSRYIRKIPNIGWKMYSYVLCDECKTLNVKPYAEGSDNDQSITECCQCHKKFTYSPKVFLVPAQGFVADGDKIKKPGLKKPECTYRGEISYVGFTEVEAKRYQVGKAIVEVKSSQNDEMAVLNTSPFYVCQQCGYTEMDERQYTDSMNKKHNTSSGFPCSNQKLRRFAIGYRFATDVVRIRFENYEINEFEKGLSILYALLRGICSYLNIEENDISGCLQSNPIDGRWNYSIVIFDNTPGGAGHAKRLDDQKALDGILRKTLSSVKTCVCGGDEGDSSCYSCLRSYKNQKYHDILKRKYVIEFLRDILE